MGYLVTALRNDEAVVSLPVDADSGESAAESARRLGYIVLGVRKTTSTGSRRKARRFSSVQFSKELLALLAAGLTLIEALEALESESRYGGTAVVASLVTALKEGLTFSAAIARHPQYFPALYMATVQSSERTGSLQEALCRYVEYQQQMTRLRKAITSASLYPALLAVVGSAVVLFLLFYVIPRFATVYESFSGALPFFSRLLIGFGRVVSDHGTLLGAAAVAMVAVMVAALRAPAVWARLGALVRAVPAISASLRLYELTRLYRTFGMLLQAGLPVTRSMSLLCPLLSTSSRPRLIEAQRRISEGRPMSDAMAQAGLVTPIAERMLIVGERTGNMGEMMERLAAFHDEEVAQAIRDFARLFEPVLMLIVGIVVGAIVVLMYLPIFELATAVQS